MPGLGVEKLEKTQGLPLVAGSRSFKLSRLCPLRWLQLVLQLHAEVEPLSIEAGKRRGGGVGGGGGLGLGEHVYCLMGVGGKAHVGLRPC